MVDKNIFRKMNTVNIYFNTGIFIGKFYCLKSTKSWNF